MHVKLYLELKDARNSTSNKSTSECRMDTNHFKAEDMNYLKKIKNVKTQN